MSLGAYRTIAIVIVVLLILMIASLLLGQTDLTIGGKNSTEQLLLVSIISDLIEAHTDLQVRQRPFLGGTLVTFQALLQGSLDGYVEYTGTGLTVMLDKDPIADPNAVYDLVKEDFAKRWDLIWMEPLGFNNIWAMTMRASHVAELGITKVSELEPYAQELVLGATHEFVERPDGYQGLQSVYGFAFAQTRTMDPGLTYQAVATGEVDIIDAYGTDGRILAFDLQPLIDDHGHFPPYHAVPLFRADVLRRHPEIIEVLQMLVGRLDDQTMRSLNYEVDSKKRDPLVVAREWLIKEGLI
ncbi:MAG TPA: glycine betaine ABC transporter substrate-binding protein [Limnochordia bacterium]|nr:glycine betaine ABC transporter substrate-binding protein [Limnochordia bacterium]